MEQLDAVDAAGEGLGVREAVQAFVGGPDVDDAAKPLAAAGDLALMEAFADQKGFAEVMYSSGVTERTTPSP